MSFGFFAMLAQGAGFDFAGGRPENRPRRKCCGFADAGGDFQSPVSALQGR
jgi:hypothetical protein